MDKEQNQIDIPTIFVVFGATGDLFSKKIAPALYHLFEKGKLPKHFKVLGFAKEQLNDDDFSKRILDDLTAHNDINVKTCTDFCSMFSYKFGDFGNLADYVNLGKALKTIDDSWGLCSNKLFHLAVPPEFLKAISENLSKSGLTAPCGGPDGWSRVLIEKPFGENSETAKALDMDLEKIFKEEQIYRIDHYLGKEMIQNILVFRFANNLFEGNWDNNSIEKIHIRLLEKIGVEQRGSFYDKVGALEDVGQNHLLQMLALITMDFPGSLESSAVRRKRAELLETLIVPTEEEIKNFTYRAQYDGYKNIDGVDKESKTETYFKVKLGMNHPKFAGVPVILESGKRLSDVKKEIEITFKHPMPCLCANNEHHKNTIVISLEPEEAIKINFWSRKPGFSYDTEERSLDFMLHEKDEERIEEYEKLILDSIMGDQMLFVSTGEIAASWRFIDPIISSWKKNSVPLNIYKADTLEPVTSSSYIEEERINPENKLKKEIGIIGLGKMGGNFAKRLISKGWKVVGYDPSDDAVKRLELEGLIGASSVEDLCGKLTSEKIVWLMVPAGKIIDDMISGEKGLKNILKEGDIVIDGGNSFYKDSVEREKILNEKGIRFVDAGVSGGPKGALYGSAIMIGGKKEVFEKIEPLFYDLAEKNGYRFFEGPGAGHFIKMIHNGIEYGMMQSIAEGFTILKDSDYKIDLENVTEVYNNGSVIESRLISWLGSAFRLYGRDFSGVSGKVARTGEGDWTVDAAKEMNIRAAVIEEALKFRIDSEKNPSYTGKILSALREQFGGHKAGE